MAIQIGGNDFDLSEIDRLVDELAHPSKRQAPPPAPRATVAAPAPPDADVMLRASATPGRIWTTANVLMPATRTEPRPAFGSSIVSRLVTWQELALDKLKQKQMQWGALSVRVFVGLGVLLSAAMPYWPYSHAWSWGLLLYLCAIEIVVVTGIWGAKLTWDARLPAAHTAALGTVIWGLGLFVWEAAPRLAYA